MATQKEQKERERTRREELGKFFYDLAKTTFAVMVLGNIVAMGTSEKVGMAGFWVFLFGAYLTFGLAYTANKILSN